MTDINEQSSGSSACGHEALVISLGNAPGNIPQLRVARLEPSNVVRTIYGAFTKDPRASCVPSGAVLLGDTYAVNEQGYHSFQVLIGSADEVFKCPVCPFPHPRCRITLSFHLNRPAVWMRCSADVRPEPYSRPIECPALLARDPSLDLNHRLVPSS